MCLYALFELNGRDKDIFKYLETFIFDCKTTYRVIQLLKLFASDTVDQIHEVHPSQRNLYIGAVHKVCHAPGGRGSEKGWQFVTGGGGGVKIMWRHTFSFFTIHNLMVYLIFYHTSLYKLKLQISPSEL